MAPGSIRVRVDGRELDLSNLDKVLFPAAGFTKGEVVDYYTRIAPVLLPHLRGRPLTRLRYPDGVDGPHFFEKNAPAGTPPWVRLARLAVPGSTGGRQHLDFVVAEDLSTLVWLANLAALELHTPQWRLDGQPRQPAAGQGPAVTGQQAPRAARPVAGAARRDPDLLVIDLDPGEPAGLRECAAVAVLLRGRLAADGLHAYPKTSGRKGMQLYCPISGTQPAGEVSAYARRLAGELARELPEAVTAQMARRLRPGRVFIDWSQNNAAKTTVAPYSLRGGRLPAVSTPLDWSEVDAVVAGGPTAALRFGPAEVLRRVADRGDLLAGVLLAGPTLPAG